MSLFKLHPLYIFYYLFTLSALSSCASRLIIQSEPSQAEVFVKVEGKKDKVSIGTTPLEISEIELLEKLKLTPESSQWIQLSFEKKEYTTREILMPSNRWGETQKVIKLNLTNNPDKTTVVNQMLSYFFNAKKFAETRQYDQAHSEIDKVLLLDAKSVRGLNMKAGIFFLEGKLDEAKKYYRDALSIDPSSSDAIKMLEKISNKNGGRS